MWVLRTELRLSHQTPFPSEPSCQPLDSFVIFFLSQMICSFLLSPWFCWQREASSWTFPSLPETRPFVVNVKSTKLWKGVGMPGCSTVSLPGLVFIIIIFRGPTLCNCSWVKILLKLSAPLRTTSKHWPGGRGTRRPCSEQVHNALVKFALPRGVKCDWVIN